MHICKIDCHLEYFCQLLSFFDFSRKIILKKNHNKMFGMAFFTFEGEPFLCGKSILYIRPRKIC